jgi:hypothetical protein
VVSRIHQTAVQPHGPENLLGGLLQVIRRENIGWVDEESRGGVEIEMGGVEELLDRTLSAAAVSAHK